MFQTIPVLNIIQPIDRARLFLTEQQKTELAPFVQHLKDIADIARNTGLLGVKNCIADETDPFLRKAMELLTETRDGQLTYSIDQVLEVMNARILSQAHDNASIVRQMLSIQALYLIYKGSLDILDEAVSAMAGFNC